MATSGESPDARPSGAVIDCAEGCLRVRVPVPFRRERAVALLGQLAGLMRERGADRVLLDTRPMTGAIKVFDRYELAKSISVALPPGARLALLSSEEQVLPDRFIQTVANNRGANILVTTVAREAADWLGVTTECIDPTP